MADQPTIPTYLRDACAHFVSRAAAVGSKSGVTRDRAAIDYLSGVARGAEIAGNLEMANHIATVIAISVCTRGYAEVVRLANS
jgi:hypothetical protein